MKHIANKRLIEIRYELKDMAVNEAMKLWRLARKAERHNVSEELVHDIRSEADTLYTNMTAYPERLVHWRFEYDFKYAFKY